MKKIQVLGSGCPSCERLAVNAEAAARQLGVDYELEKVTDVNDIVAFGVMMTPALVIDGEVKVVGEVPGTQEIARLLE